MGSQEASLSKNLFCLSEAWVCLMLAALLAPTPWGAVAQVLHCLLPVPNADPHPIQIIFSGCLWCRQPFHHILKSLMHAPIPQILSRGFHMHVLIRKIEQGANELQPFPVPCQCQLNVGAIQLMYMFLCLLGCLCKLPFNLLFGLCPLLFYCLLCLHQRQLTFHLKLLNLSV